MQLRLGLALCLSVIALTGCNTVSKTLTVNNGSLNYKKAPTVETLQYPQGVNARPVTPLYPVPTVDELALQHAPTFENQKGNRFAMPRPNETVANRTEAKTKAEKYKNPTVVVSDTGIPALKITEKPSKSWDNMLNTLTRLNYKIEGQNAARYEATVQVNEQTYLLKMAVIEKTNTFALFTPTKNFAQPAQAKVLLDQISQNWKPS